jgi:hypothetical protein
MKSSLMRPALAVALALGLTACGGKATFPITGSVTNLQYPGLVLETNGQTVTVAPTGSTTDARFTFPNQLDYGVEYNITVKTQPAHQACSPTTAAVADVAGRLEKIDVNFSCRLVSPTVGGKITGLHANNLVLINGSQGTQLALNGVSTTNTDGTTTITYPTAFTFPATVDFGSTYGITVLTQPDKQTCTVVGGTGVMGDTAVDTIAVNCVDN